ncbi:MAG: histidine kinase N-terminal domain-containing protein [Ardenticatenia bacterium]|nr:histidine kinase N-terminal domain-containing protein [Ardenticatenia bacterium]
MSSLLELIASSLSIFADLNRADVLLYATQPDGSLLLVEQAAPHSVPPVYRVRRVGISLAPGEQPALARVLSTGRPTRSPRHQEGFRAHIVQEAHPIYEGGQLVGVLSVEKSLIEHERHRTRRWPFRRALLDLRDMLLRGDVHGFDELSPFREHDGIMLVDAQGIITYLSGLGSHHYRRLGYYGELIGLPVSQLHTADSELVARALDQRRAFEHETTEGDRIWIRKVIPLVGPRWRLPPPFDHLFSHGVGHPRRVTVLVTIHDATLTRRKAEEQAVRRAMVQEIHHRVKNNLQTIASLLRIQARRATHEETRQALSESIHRILSVAVVHEFLSQHEGLTINLRDVTVRIVNQVREGILDPAKHISFHVEGPPIFLPPQQTTMCALVINELLLNALEHGFNGLNTGTITVRLVDEGDHVRILVQDDGAGLPANFDLEHNSSLGLHIVRTVVRQDLRGHFELHNGQGVSAIITFPKVTVGEWEPFG